MKFKHFSILFLVAALVPVAGMALTDQELLGQNIYFDENLSVNGNQSCATCHHPTAGFADPANLQNPDLLPTSDGSLLISHNPVFFGGRNAPTSSYSGFSPIFHYDSDEDLFIGGTFWDGRASGRMDVTATGDLGNGATGDPIADQAKGPFLNPVEMSLKDEKDVIKTILQSDYAVLFEQVCGQRMGSKKDYSVTGAYNCMADAIAAFERSEELNKFTSVFDGYLAGTATLSEEETEGMELFNADFPDGGQCYLCHLTENHVVDATFNPTNGFNLTGPNGDGSYNPMFTDFTYDNLGIPKNPIIEILAGPQAPDLGLGSQTALLEAAHGAGYDPAVASDLEGAFKVSTLRNIAVTAPYGHNGYFPTLTSIVQFYNTRDVYQCDSVGGTAATPDLLAQDLIPGYPEGEYNGYCWDTPEFAGTMNVDELGNLELSREEVDKIVAFMETLTDQ